MKKQQKKQIVLILSLVVLSISFIGIGNQALESNNTSIESVDNSMNFAKSSSAHKEGKVISTYLGDANLDGKINSSDALAILNMSVGISKKNAVADINQDGKINSNDASEALKISIKSSSTKKKIDVYKDNNGRVAILYKQNDATNNSVAYKGRYNHGEYLTTWKNKSISAKKTDNANPTLGVNGCGPTSAAIVASSLGQIVNPKLLVNNKTTGYSTTDDLINYFKSIKLNASTLDFGYDNYIKALDNNKKLLLLTGTSSSYSSVIGTIGERTLQQGKFHWYTILDYRINGSKKEFYVGDPYLWDSGKTSNCKWIDSSKILGIYSTIQVSA